MSEETSWRRDCRWVWIPQKNGIKSRRIERGMWQEHIRRDLCEERPCGLGKTGSEVHS